ncbi:MAG: rod shape-determining protein RodA [Rickettsiaceae bacterium]|nr:rod shape-determining protein RodA [Rickettsiaceae bacterium]
MDNSKSIFFNKLKNIPFSIPIFVSIICIYGFIVLYSAAGASLEPWAYRQIVRFCFFMLLAFLIAFIDLRFIFKTSYLLYFIVILLLIAVNISGINAKGATRWVDLGLFRAQPSELAKIAVVLMLARYFHNMEANKLLELKHLLPAIIAVIIPAALIIKQPDLGTAIITLLVATTMFFAIGTRIIYFIISGILLTISLPVIWYMMHEYQRRRVLTFLDPERDPLGAGYNIIQSKIALGSGGLFGKGLFSGTQSHLSFLPEYQTDFIFSFLTEELGFVGGLVLIILYFIVVVNCLAVAINCRNIFSKLMVIGVTTIFFSHVIINIAMVMGLLPAVGVPLPLVSYGGTMMGSMLIGFGLIMNAAVNSQNSHKLS